MNKLFQKLSKRKEEYSLLLFSNKQAIPEIVQSRNNNKTQTTIYINTQKDSGIHQNCWQFPDKFVVFTSLTRICNYLQEKKKRSETALTLIIWFPLRQNFTVQYFEFFFDNWNFKEIFGKIRKKSENVIINRSECKYIWKKYIFTINISDFVTFVCVITPQNSFL